MEKSLGKGKPATAQQQREGIKELDSFLKSPQSQAMRIIDQISRLSQLLVDDDDDEDVDDDDDDGDGDNNDSNDCISNENDNKNNSKSIDEVKK